MAAADTRIEAPAELDELLARFEAEAWTDGLPIVPPTEDRVAALVEASGLDAGTVVGHVPMAWGEATVELVAANAVMAGCEPRHFPVVLAALRATLTPDFNLYGIQATTHPVAPMTVVHGPIARELGVHGGSGALGPGFRANACIGRALRLTLMNVGATYPGEADRATQGTPAKFTYCASESPDCPWPEFHTTRGFEAQESAVSVFGLEAPHNINDHQSDDPGRVLDIAADVMRALGNNNWYLAHHGRTDFVVALGPEHARLAADEGWSREDVRDYLYHAAVRTVADLRTGGQWSLRDWPAWTEALARRDDALVPVVRRPEDIHVLVIGGPGKHSAVMPGFGISHGATLPIAA